MTGTVIDSLVVTLGLDPSDFTKGQKAAAESLIKTRDSAGVVAKDMEAKGKQAAAFFSQVKNEALGLIGVLLGAQGLESFVRQTTTSLVAMGNAARNIGMPIGELAAFGMMVERHGGNAAAAAASFQKLTDAANNFAILGQGSQYASIMTMLQLNPGAKGTDVYSALLKYASEHNNARGIQETRTYGQMLGLDEGTMNTLFDQVAKGGVAKFRDEMAESMRLGVPTQEMSDAMKQLMHDWNALTQAAGHFGEVMLTNVQPYLSHFLEWSTEMVVKNPDTTLAIGGLTSAFLTFSAMSKLTGLFGLTAIADKLAFVSRFIGVAGAWLATLSLSGDTPGGGDGYKPPPGHVPGFLNDLWYQWAPESLGGRPRSGGGGGGSGGKAITDPDEQKRLASIRDRLSSDLGISREAAAGVLSNLWAESHVRGINEANPTVPGSRGGFGWAQWTGLRRVDFEAYAAQHKLDPASDDASYGFLVQELRDKYPDLLKQMQAGNISARQAASIFFQYESGGAPGLEMHRLGHIDKADQISKFGSAPMDQYVPSALGGGAHSSSNKNVNIGDVHVYTQSTDAHGISKEINAHLSRAITDSNRGLE